MSKRDKLRKKLRNQPNDADIKNVETLLQRFGFKLVRVRGSHYIFEYDDGKQTSQIIVPLHRRKVKKIYVTEVLDAIDVLFPIEELSEESDE